MAIRNIVQVGDPVLRKKSFEVVDFGAKTKELLDDMKETLIKADGAGLAAPQVGVLRRVFITYIDGVFKEYINPQIISFSGKQVGEEGCLSVKGKFGTVEKPLKVTIKAQDRNGNFFTNVAEGFEAKAIFHENDHLDGILYIDKAKNIGED